MNYKFVTWNQIKNKNAKEKPVQNDNLLPFEFLLDCTTNEAAEIYPIVENGVEKVYNHIMTEQVKQTHTELKQRNPDIVSNPPLLDVKKAFISSEHAASLLKEKGITNPALLQAGGLLFYNDGITPHSHQQFRDVIAGELQASSPEDPRPSIGTELEIPTFKKKKGGDSLPYKAFFETLGFSENEHNAEDKFEKNLYWEVSPAPSYSSNVQAVLLAGLMKSRIIPTITDPELTAKKTGLSINQLIQNNIAEKMYGLHINLGTPEHVQKTLGLEDDLHLLSGMLAVAFTSDHRLSAWEHAGHPLELRKTGEKTAKNPTGTGRIEMRFFDLPYTGDAHELLTSAQFLTAAACSEHTPDGNLRLAEIWYEFKEGLRDELFPDQVHHGELETLVEKCKNGDTIEDLRNITNIKPQARAYIKKYVSEIGQDLQKNNSPLTNPSN